MRNRTLHPHAVYGPLIVHPYRGCGYGNVLWFHCPGYKEALPRGQWAEV